MRPIDADALKDKLQQHHDFYVMAWGGFGKMPIGEKKRVDEITNCIAEVVNAPTIEPKQGEWRVRGNPKRNLWECSLCRCTIYSESERDRNEFHKWCGRCGARMEGADDD